MDIYGEFTLKEGIISLSLHKIRCAKITISFNNGLILQTNTRKLYDYLYSVGSFYI